MLDYADVSGHSEVLKIDGTTKEQWKVQCDGISPTHRKKVFFILQYLCSCRHQDLSHCSTSWYIRSCKYTYEGTRFTQIVLSESHMAEPSLHSSKSSNEKKMLLIYFKPANSYSTID